MKKIKFFGILTLLLIGLAVPNNEILQTNAASDETELLSYVYDLFADENIIEYDDINYFMSIPEEDVLQYEINCPLNTELAPTICEGTYQREYYYSHVNGEINKNVLNDVLFNNFWNFSSVDLALGDKFYLAETDESYPNNFEEEYRAFDFGGNSQTNPQFWNEVNTAETTLTKEELVCNPGISFVEADGEGGATYKKSSFASLGGVSLIEQTMYLNSSFDESLKENNNFEICLIDTTESGYDMDDFVYYNQVLAAFFAKDTYYNYPLISVNGKPFIYVVFEGTGGDTNTNFYPHIVCINSKFRMNWALDNIGFYLSIPYHEYIETINITLPQYTSTYCWDVDDQYCNEEIGLDVINEVASYMSFNPYWWNDDTIEKVTDNVEYHPVSMSGIDNVTDMVTFKCFTSEWVSRSYNDVYVESFNLIDVSDNTNYSVQLGDVPVETESYDGAYVYCTYDISSGMPISDHSKTFKLDSVDFQNEYRVYDYTDYHEDLCFNPVIYNTDSNKYGNTIKYKKNRTKQRVYLDYCIDNDSLFKTLLTLSYTRLYFSFYYNSNFVDKISGIDNISISYKYGDGSVNNFSVSDDSTFSEYKEYNGDIYYSYSIGSRCIYSPIDYEIFKSLNPGNLFMQGSSGFHYLTKKQDGYDFELYHPIKMTSYRKCKYVDVNYAYCDFWVDSNTYILGGSGDLGLSVEYNDVGEFIGVTDLNGNVLPDYSVDSDGNILNPDGSIYVDDSSRSKYTYYGDLLPDIFDSFLGGSDGTFNFSDDFRSILLVIGILIIVLIIIKFYPSIKKMFKNKRKNKKKRN